MNADDPRKASDAARGTDASFEGAASDDRTIPIVEERLRVEKREVERGTVRVSTEIDHVQETVDTKLRQQHAQLDRVKVDRVVDAIPEPRLEGDVIVVPIVEERAVVTKQIVVVEEVRIRLDEEFVTDSQTVELAKERLKVDRIPTAEERVADASPLPGAGDTPAHTSPNS